MIKVNFQGELRSVGLREFNKRDGSKGYAYPLMFETADSSYNVTADVETYNRFVRGDLKKGDMCNFTAEYEPKFQYNNFIIVGVEVVPSK